MSYKPGTVATATVRGEPNVRVMRVATSEFDSNNWRSERIVKLSVIHDDDDVTDIRPLVVIDPEDYHAVREVVQRSEYMEPGELVGPLVSAIMEGLRAVVPQGPIPEPGVWGVVEARIAKNGTVWHATKYPDGMWHVDDGGQFDWEDLVDPVLIRPGLE